MKVLIGKKGLGKSCQTRFTATTECHECKGTARIMFVAFEDQGEIGKADKIKFVCDLHANTGARKNGKFWLHDACACAVYLCEKCFEPTAIINQA